MEKKIFILRRKSLVGLTLGLQRNSFTKDYYFRTFFRMTFLNFEYFQFKSWSEKSFEQWQFELPHPNQSQVQFKRRSKDYYFTIEFQPRVLELSLGIEILTKISLRRKYKFFAWDLNQFRNYCNYSNEN